MKYNTSAGAGEGRVSTSAASTRSFAANGKPRVSFRGDCMRVVCNHTDNGGLGGTVHDTDAIQEDEYELVVDHSDGESSGRFENTAMHEKERPTSYRGALPAASGVGSKSGLGANSSRAGDFGPFWNATNPPSHGGSRPRSARSARGSGAHHGSIAQDGGEHKHGRDSSASSSSSHGETCERARSMLSAGIHSVAGDTAAGSAHFSQFSSFATVTEPPRLLQALPTSPSQASIPEQHTTFPQPPTTCANGHKAASADSGSEKESPEASGRFPAQPQTSVLSSVGGAHSTRGSFQGSGGYGGGSTGTAHLNRPFPPRHLTSTSRENSGLSDAARNAICAVAAESANTALPAHTANEGTIDLETTLKNWSLHGGSILNLDDGFSSQPSHNASRSQGGVSMPGAELSRHGEPEADDPVLPGECASATHHISSAVGDTSAAVLDFDNMPSFRALPDSSAHSHGTAADFSSPTEHATRSGGVGDGQHNAAPFQNTATNEPDGGLTFNLPDFMQFAQEGFPTTSTTESGPVAPKLVNPLMSATSPSSCAGSGLSLSGSIFNTSNIGQKADSTRKPAPETDECQSDCVSAAPTAAERQCSTTVDASIVSSDATRSEQATYEVPTLDFMRFLQPDA